MGSAIEDPGAARLRDRATYLSPTRGCDVVMKGGITSGVLHPHAVCELATAYQLRSVGGTSAGAIAAAAAELGRTSKRPRRPVPTSRWQWMCPVRLPCSAWRPAASDRPAGGGRP